MGSINPALELFVGRLKVNGCAWRILSSFSIRLILRIIKKIMSATSKSAPTPPPIAAPSFLLSSPAGLALADGEEVRLEDEGGDIVCGVAVLYTAP